MDLTCVTANPRPAPPTAARAVNWVTHAAVLTAAFAAALWAVAPPRAGWGWVGWEESVDCWWRRRSIRETGKLSDAALIQESNHTTAANLLQGRGGVTDGESGGGAVGGAL